MRELSGSGERRPLESSAKSPLRLHFDYERDDVLEQITSKNSQINSLGQTSQNTLNLTLGNIPKRETTQTYNSSQATRFQEKAGRVETMPTRKPLVVPKVPRPNNCGRQDGAQSSGVAKRNEARRSLRSAFAMVSSDSETSDDMPTAPK